MEMRLLLIALALIGAFGCALVAVKAAGLSLRRRKAVLSGRANDASFAMELALWRLRNGFSFLIAPARALLRVARIEDVMRAAVDALAKNGIVTTRSEEHTSELQSHA